MEDNSENKLVTIALKPTTKRKLADIGSKLDSYDDIVQRLIELYNKFYSEN